MSGPTGESIDGSCELLRDILGAQGTALLVTPDGNVRVLRSEKAAPIEVEAAELAAENHRRVVYSTPIDVLMDRRKPGSMN